MSVTSILGVPVLFTSFGSESDRLTALDFVRRRSRDASLTDFLAGPTGSEPRYVLIVGIPASSSLVEGVQALKAEGFLVFLRDNHEDDISTSTSPPSPGQLPLFSAVAQLRGLLGTYARINQGYRSSCSMIQPAQFEDARCIIANTTGDGFLSAMKAAGVFYRFADGGETAFDRDALLLDTCSVARLSEGLSPLGLLLAKGLLTLRLSGVHSPQSHLEDLFDRFALAVQGDPTAREALLANASRYDAAVAEAKRLASQIREVLPGVLLLDVTGSPASGWDLGSLSLFLQTRPDCKVSVIRTSSGPIAKQFGVQYSLCEATPGQLNLLYDPLPPDPRCMPEALERISSPPWLHVSERLWIDTVLPALRRRFTASEK
jgi:hypothetical protein